MSDVRVLIVDDQLPFREAMRMVVDVSDGFECVGEACNGAEAVELARSLRPDLVLIDVQMPEMDGLTATRAIRLDDPTIHVVVLSTHESGDFAGPAAASGATAFIPKSSFGLEALAETWERAASGGDEPAS